MSRPSKPIDLIFASRFPFLLHNQICREWRCEHSKTVCLPNIFCSIAKNTACESLHSLLQLLLLLLLCFYCNGLSQVLLDFAAGSSKTIFYKLQWGFLKIYTICPFSNQTKISSNWREICFTKTSTNFVDEFFRLLWYFRPMFSRVRRYTISLYFMCFTNNVVSGLAGKNSS